MPRLRAFQREDSERLKKHNLRAIIASAPGTGKTPLVVRTLAETYWSSMPAAVVCPSSVVENWQEEVQVWAPGTETIIIDTLSGPLPRARQRNTIYILGWAILDDRWRDLKALGLRTIVADEIHYAKNPDTLRSQALRELTAAARHVMVMSGTPVVNEKAEFEVVKSYVGPNPLVIRRLLEDVAPDIPPKTRSYLHVDLRPRFRQLYDRADSDFEEWLIDHKSELMDQGMAEYEAERALAQQALLKIGYLRRLVGEYKVPAAADWIARAVRLGEPVVVFLEHQVPLKRLRRALSRMRIRHVVVEGSTPPKLRQEAVTAFQRHEYPVFIGTKAAKEGITLTAARHLLFLERFWTSADEEQAEDRIRRISQKHRTTIWFLHAVDTVDDRLDLIVKEKRKVVKKAIGSRDIAETPLGTVFALLRDWEKHALPRVKPRKLGLGEPLPPLPSPSITHGVVFAKTRWTRNGARAWCRMHGYDIETIRDLGDRWKLIVHPAVVFQSKSFGLDRISRDIKVITGKRLSPANEKRVRRTIR